MLPKKLVQTTHEMLLVIYFISEFHNEILNRKYKIKTEASIALHFV